MRSLLALPVRPDAVIVANSLTRLLVRASCGAATGGSKAS